MARSQDLRALSSSSPWFKGAQRAHGSLGRAAFKGCAACVKLEVAGVLVEDYGRKRRR